MLQPGSRLGKYEVIEQIGSGGMGAVYKARDPVLDREVAIKVIATSIQSQDIVARFRTEAKAAAQLEHPNILSVFDFLEEGGTACLVMPFFRGHTLEWVLAQAAPIPFQTVKTILEQIASALDFAHSHGIVHRDVKPSNIMIDEDMARAVLMDFGIAKMRESERGLTRTGDLIGTMRYMAPEQISMSKVSERSDQYALALIAFEMLTGRQPFSGDSDFQILTAKVQEVPPLVTDLRRDLPASTAVAVARALSQNPAERFSQVAEFVEAAFGGARAPSEFQSVTSPPLPPTAAQRGPEILRWLSQPFSRLFKRSADEPAAP